MENGNDVRVVAPPFPPRRNPWSHAPAAPAPQCEMRSTDIS
jgi:hypothetical protein